MNQLNMLWNWVLPAEYLGLAVYGTTRRTVPVCDITMKMLNLLRRIMVTTPWNINRIKADRQPVTIHVYTSI